MNCAFSSGHICRFCTATYKDVSEDLLLYRRCQEDYQPRLMTPEYYDELADLAVENGGSSPETLGIKNHCVFNSLLSFHCIGGMAPCLGHDFYEGVFAYDIQSILNYIINVEKLMTAETFNSKLNNCQMSIRDRRNRPCIFKTRSAKSKYEGSSGSLRVLSRVLPFILASCLEKSNTMDILLKLLQVSEIITAPQLSYNEVIDILEPTIIEYLDLRVSAVDVLNFSKPRPKHHFLSHYGESYLRYGPLIGVWAMRMESKHTFMKKVLRSAKNFINPSKTCASRHQLAQVSHVYIGLFPSRIVQVPDDTLCVYQVPDTQESFQRRFLTQLDPKSLYPSKVIILGTSYEPGMVLILKKIDFGLLKVGILKGLNVKSNKVMFACSTFECTQSKYGYYVSTKLLSDFECVMYTELWDYHPLHRIGTPQAFIFTLHHFISQR